MNSNDGLWSSVKCNDTQSGIKAIVCTSVDMNVTATEGPGYNDTSGYGNGTASNGTNTQPYNLIDYGRSTVPMTEPSGFDNSTNYNETGTEQTDDKTSTEPSGTHNETVTEKGGPKTAATEQSPFRSEGMMDSCKSVMNTR